MSNGKIINEETSPTGYIFLCDHCEESTFFIHPTEDGDCFCECEQCGKRFDICWSACNLGSKDDL